MQQVDVTDLPDVIQAQRRHYRLLRKHGHVVLSACFEHCSDLWDAVVRRGYRPSDRRRRLDTLGTSHPEIWGPRRYIAVYPEVVAATALYASPHWRKLARSEDSGYLRFRAEFIRQLPQERILRRSSKPWFLKELGNTALRIEDAIAAALACGSSESSGDPAGELVSQSARWPPPTSSTVTRHDRIRD